MIPSLVVLLMQARALRAGNIHAVIVHCQRTKAWFRCFLAPHHAGIPEWSTICHLQARPQDSLTGKNRGRSRLM
jgi:hypothetical protein